MKYKIPKPQDKQSINPKDYKVRIIVAGTRNWADKKLFHEVIVDYIERFSEAILFISGAARTGADRYIIDWCKKYQYPCMEMPADWDTHGKSAGYVRNTEMSEVGTHLVCFWDTKSKGTANMREIASEKHMSVTTILVEPIQ
jgi:hypothetical protein